MYRYTILVLGTRGILVVIPRLPPSGHLPSGKQPSKVIRQEVAFGLCGEQKLFLLILERNATRSSASPHTVQHIDKGKTADGYSCSKYASTSLSGVATGGLRAVGPPLHIARQKALMVSIKTSLRCYQQYICTAWELLPVGH